jgi:hypothetical protein
MVECASLMAVLLMAVLGLCPNQGAAVAVRALTAGGNGRELRPFWNVVLMAVRDETTAFISHGCGGVVRFERENAEERPPSSAFQQQK